MSKQLRSGKFLNSVKSRNKDTIRYLDSFDNIKYIYQSDFKEGTYRIMKPGKYKLYEDIVFNPNPHNNSKPASYQENKYPTKGPYVLGFFAMITIESSDVKLDLNGYEISVSEEFNQNQRFASLIELGNSPFNTSQGPANFGKLNQAPSNIEIYNGRIGKSPHHGIRGNNNDKLTLKNLTFKNFEVAAISLHGSTNVLMENILIDGVNERIFSFSQYAQSLFILPIIERIHKKDKNYMFNGKSVEQVYRNLVQEISQYKNYIFRNKSYDGFYKNTEQLPDGNVYGILLHTKGVAVGAMVEERDENSVGNENIVLRNIRIRNIRSNSVEILSIKNLKDEKSKKSYVGKLITGPVGDVVKMNKIMNDQSRYKGDYLSDAQFLIAKRKYDYPDEKYGTTSIPQELIKWAENNEDFKLTSNTEFVKGNDSMGHVMKGNHGILVSCGKNILFNNVKIENVENYGNNDYRFDNSKFMHLEKDGKILKQFSITRSPGGIGLNMRKDENNNCCVVKGLKGDVNSRNNMNSKIKLEDNPALGKICVDDIIIAADNIPVKDSREISFNTRNKKRGDEVWLTLLRDLDKDSAKNDMFKLSCGVCLTGCENVFSKNLSIKNIISKYGNSHNILKKNFNENINI
tara:strand:+ start:22396 stop:24288 length:1893 start_codon:yes stop_codon:yes gene_type:complete